MTLEEAIYYLDPATTREALFGLEMEEAIPIIEEACRVACDTMRAAQRAGAQANK